MYTTPTLQGLFTAVSIGLLIGVMRERGHADGSVAVAGVRTHALVAICASVATGFGITMLTALLLAMGALALSGYLRTREHDPGLTGEIALLATTLLAAAAQYEAALAAGLGVIVAALLFAKRPLQRFARNIVSEQEVRDALLLAAAALVVLPMVPDEAVDPWGVLIPSKVWKLVVLVMAVACWATSPCAPSATAGACRSQASFPASPLRPQPWPASASAAATTPG